MILERRPDDFAERNLLLQLTMGLIATSKTLDELLEAYAPVARSSHPPPVEGDDPPPAEDTGALFILGLIAFKERLAAALATTPEPPTRDPSAAPTTPLEDLLR